MFTVQFSHMSNMLHRSVIVILLLGTQQEKVCVKKSKYCLALNSLVIIVVPMQCYPHCHVNSTVSIKSAYSG